MMQRRSNGESLATAKPRIQSVSRALAILLVVADSDDGLSAKELSQLVDLSLSTTHHLVQTLTAEGFLTRTETRRYVLGLRIGTLAEAFERQLHPTVHLMPYVRALASRTGEAAYVAGWSKNQILILGEAPGRHAVNVTDLRVGLAVDAHARASGKLLLAHAPASVRSEYLRRHPPQPRTQHTITALDELEAEFAQIRDRGYAIDQEEFTLGVCCLGAPLDRGTSPFVLSMSVPRERFEQSFDTYLEAILETAREASSSALAG